MSTNLFNFSAVGYLKHTVLQHRLTDSPLRHVWVASLPCDPFIEQKLGSPLLGIKSQLTPKYSFGLFLFFSPLEKKNQKKIKLFIF